MTIIIDQPEFGKFFIGFLSVDIVLLSNTRKLKNACD